MLIRFKVCNLKSFKEPTELSMKAEAIKEHPENTYERHMSGKLLKSIAIFGANAAGKSNFIRAIAAALIIIRTSETRQINEPIPLIDQFAFCTNRKNETSFEFEFTQDEYKYIYGFSCTRNQITEEYLTAYNSQRPTRIFTRSSDTYEFYNKESREQLLPLTKRNTSNKLFIATATVWNSELTKKPYLWLRNCIDVFDSDNPMLQSLELYEKDKSGKLRNFTNNLLKEADINIADFTVESKEIKNTPPLFIANLPSVQREYKVMAMHTVKSSEDNDSQYYLPMQNESKGTRNLFFLSPWIEKALERGYVFCVDELDSSMHPALLLYIVNLFNSPKTNPHGAQLIMTTHTTDLLSTSIMRRDQLLFIEKDNNNGMSELYSLNDFSARTREDIRKAYIAGRFGAVPNIL